MNAGLGQGQAGHPCAVTHDSSRLRGSVAATPQHALGVAEVPPAPEENAPMLLALTRAGESEVADFLVARGLAGRVDAADGHTSVLLVDLHFRPVSWELTSALGLAAATGQPVTLLAGDWAGDSGSAAAIAGDSSGAFGQVAHPDGRFEPMTREQVAAASAAVPGRAETTDRWLIIGQAPDQPVAEIIANTLPAHGRIQANLWQEQDWFLAQITAAPAGVEAGLEVPESLRDDAQAGPELAAAIATAVRTSGARVLRGAQRPVMVVRHSNLDTAIMQPGANGWADFVLEWGLRRTWVHPRWGVAVVDQDAAATEFAQAWTRAGGTADPVNLRALSRRRHLPGEVLRPVLGCLHVPTPMMSRAVALASGTPVATATPNGVPLAAPEVIRGRAPASVGNKRRGPGLGSRVTARAMVGLGVAVGTYVGLHAWGAGVSGWDWAMIAGAAVVAVAGLAGTTVLRTDRAEGDEVLPDEQAAGGDEDRVIDLTKVATGEQPKR